MITTSTSNIKNCTDIYKLYNECLSSNTENKCKWIIHRHGTCKVMCNLNKNHPCKIYINIIGKDILKTITKNKIE